jgi:urocanate hydratase
VIDLVNPIGAGWRLVGKGLVLVADGQPADDAISRVATLEEAAGVIRKCWKE